jgi:cob(I)alamin adenosyltransferase
MEKAYKEMSDTDLDEMLRRTQNKLEDAEDELEIINGQSQSGQHMSSKYFQSHCGRIEQDIKYFHEAIEEINTEIKNRKK